MKWNTESYSQHKNIHFSPFNDLLSLIDLKKGLKVIDLGCGTGELTRKLADNLPGSDVLGIDSSNEMLSKSGEYSCIGLEFKCISVEDAIESKQKWDLVFSHATIQWIDNHSELISKLMSITNEGGQIAVQFPSNDNLHTHKSAIKVAEQEPFCSALNGWYRKSPILSIDEYAELLIENGAINVTIFEKVYPQLFNDLDALTNWVSSTMLLPYFERLPKELHDAFINAYKQELAEKWIEKPILYPFRRTFIVAANGG